MVIENVNEIGKMKLVREFIFFLRNQLEETEDEFERRKIFGELKDLLCKELKKAKDGFLVNMLKKELMSILEVEIENTTDSTYRTELVDELKDILWKEIKCIK